MRAPGLLHGHGRLDDLERGHPLPLALPPPPCRKRLTEASMAAFLMLVHFISLKMLGNIFDNFVFSFVANTKHLLLE